MTAHRTRKTVDSGTCTLNASLTNESNHLHLYLGAKFLRLSCNVESFVVMS